MADITFDDLLGLRSVDEPTSQTKRRHRSRTSAVRSTVWASTVIITSGISAIQWPSFSVTRDKASFSGIVTISVWKHLRRSQMAFQAGHGNRLSTGQYKKPATLADDGPVAWAPRRRGRMLRLLPRSQYDLALERHIARTHEAVTLAAEIAAMSPAGVMIVCTVESQIHRSRPDGVLSCTKAPRYLRYLQHRGALKNAHQS